MRLKKQLLLVSFLLFFSVLAMASKLSETDNSTTIDSVRLNNFHLNHTSLTDSIVNYGKLFLNTPYHFGSPGTSSFDCSGFTSYVYRNFGYNLEHSSSVQAKQFDSIDRAHLKAGDLVFFSGSRRSKRVGHVGIVTAARENGEFDFIHAAVHEGVTISSSNEEYYTRRFLKASRVVDPNQMFASTKLILNSDRHVNDTIAFTPLVKPAQSIRTVIPAKYHRVKKGETLSSISEKYGMTVAELKRKNKIKGSKLSLKQNLRIKDEETVMVVQAAPSTTNNSVQVAENTTKANDLSKVDQKNGFAQTNSLHTVQKGETLFSISRLYNISVEELKKLNNIIRGKIHAGQEIKINQPAIEPKKEALAKTEVTSKQTTHKVISGESLFSISKEHNIPVDELTKINNIADGKIHAGQELKLSNENEIKTQNVVADKQDNNQITKIKNIEKPVFYKIRKGDNLRSIAKENNLTVEELKRINNLTNSRIQPGQKIKISQEVESKNDNALVKETDKKQEIKQLSVENKQPYKVKKGESLISIAKENDMSVDELMKINNLTDSKIRFGQELKLTQTSETPSTKTTIAENRSRSIKVKAKSGESFYTIAKKYGCTVKDLKEWNHKSESKIKIGEEITVFAKAKK